MNDNKNKQAQEEALDDVDRLFARLGSKGAEEYRDFTPGQLPRREAARETEARRVAADPAPPPPAPPILAAIRPLRVEPAAVQRLSAVIAPAEAAAPASPLGALFQRLLQAEAVSASAGPLRRMFGR